MILISACVSAMTYFLFVRRLYRDERQLGRNICRSWCCCQWHWWGVGIWPIGWLIASVRCSFLCQPVHPRWATGRNFIPLGLSRNEVCVNYVRIVFVCVDKYLSTAVTPSIVAFLINAVVATMPLRFAWNTFVIYQELVVLGFAPVR